ncbi:unnamed protein product [Rotaria magnacalcarata]|uniref:Uncharacterized protein n=1 Tax=Rotaria magnacalcarata TaxID=392030 RepID=A0A815XD13_9BILA|nr:unnamed protein product [Rotaria magnacalcarata]CAF1555889.1 unnamed protein product [Rotaria magnacalcarata]CAF4437349.1 unnamed protein product [Rotaria magnacalcarata]CAF4476691.1 unnamed protein product [Rotaria magnacalcarata]
MNLDLLANELLLDLFEYQSGVHLLRTFHNLNSRFDNLLIVHFQTHDLDFRSLSTYAFDIICEQYLPLIADRIITLRLPNNDNTPQEIELFLADDFALRTFLHLRSLSFNRIYSIETMNKVTRQCCHLPYLIHLKFMSCSLNCNRAIRLNTVDQIWSLPKLTRCHLDIKIYKRFVIPTVHRRRSL